MGAPEVCVVGRPPSLLFCESSCTLVPGSGGWMGGLLVAVFCGVVLWCLPPRLPFYPCPRKHVVFRVSRFVSWLCACSCVCVCER